ncbi:MAG: hypothetical protein AAFN07_15775 [Pseudomonadota bacterium]
MNKWTLLMTTSALMLAGCATNTREVATVESEAAPDREIEIGFGAYGRADYGMFAVLERNSDGWQAVKIVDSRSSGRQVSLRDREGQEVLFISSDLRFAEPFFEDQSQISLETVNCDAFFNKNNLYNPCASRFMTNNAFMSLGKSAWSIITNMGMSAGTHKALDHDAVAEAIAETDLLATIGKKVADIEYQEYRATFDNAKTAADFSFFIDQYARDDPDRLISQAIDRRNALLYKEELARQGIDPVTLQARKAQASADDLASFRANVKPGTNTNCGPVLAAEGGWLRVQKAVDGHGDVHWIPQEQIFPPNFDCEFKNGEYVSPL